MLGVRGFRSRGGKMHDARICNKVFDRPQRRIAAVCCGELGALYGYGWLLQERPAHLLFSWWHCASAEHVGGWTRRSCCC
jgi:hypothetical protein